MQNILIYLGLIFIMLQSGGCTTILHHAEHSGTPAFGSSVRLAASEQTANPEAGSDAPVVGIDGKYAAAAAAKYQEGPRKKEEAKSSSIFGIVDNNK